MEIRCALLLPTLHWTNCSEMTRPRSDTCTSLAQKSWRASENYCHVTITTALSREWAQCSNSTSPAHGKSRTTAIHYRVMSKRSADSETLCSYEESTSTLTGQRG